MDVLWDFFASTFQVVSANVHIFGWISLVFTVGRLSWMLSKKINGFIESFSLSQERLSKMEESISLLATNHLPHIQDAVEKTNTQTDTLLEEIRGMRRDILQFMISRK